jgi:ubiquinone/menaquinone biosynthesis C-methylase UbiE
MSAKDYWETAYENGEYEHWEFSYPSPELVALVAAGIPRKNARVLDVGCGGGTDAIFMAQRGYKVTGVDISSAALKIAEKRAKKANIKVNWQKGNAFELPIENESIDFLTDRGLLHLIEDPDRPKYASEILRVLKNNGRALIRGASEESAAQDRFNPITEEAIEKYFSASKFKRGPILPIPLFSVLGLMDARIVMLQKRGTIKFKSH